MSCNAIALAVYAEADNRFPLPIFPLRMKEFPLFALLLHG